MSTTDDRLRDHFHRGAADAPADEALLDTLRAEALRRRRRRRTTTAGFVAAAAVVVTVLGLAVVNSDGSPEEVDVVAPTTTTTTTTTPTTTTAPATRDWDGARFDLGRIERVHREDDEWLVDFDRVQLTTDDGGLASGPDFTEEPVVVGNTDEPTVNENLRLRTYALRPDAEALVIDNLRDTCSYLETWATPRWRRITLDELASGRELWDEFTQVALTFDPQGYVMRVRLASGC